MTQNMQSLSWRYKRIQLYYDEIEEEEERKMGT
jgi:hypothetical protein